MKYAKILYLFILFGAMAHGQTHSVTLTTTNTSCTTTAPCTLQVYRASGTCATVAACTWAAVTLTSLVSTPTTTGTTWTGADTSPALTAGQAYSWYTTNTFNSGGGASSPSDIFSGTIPAAPVVPATPVLKGVVNW